MNRLPLKIELLACEYLCDVYGIEYKPYTYENGDIGLGYFNERGCAILTTIGDDKYYVAGYNRGKCSIELYYTHADMIHLATLQAGGEDKVFAMLFAGNEESQL